MSSEWWQVPAARADLEHALCNLNAFNSSPPEGLTAHFCELCEVLTDLLGTAARCTVTAEEDEVIGGLQARLERRLSTTTYVDQQAIDKLEALAGSIVRSLLAEPQEKLAVYGTLAPGEVNHGVVADIVGRWTEGFVRGDLQTLEWGAGLGLPVLVWRPAGPRVPVALLSSHDLVDHWQRLDRFEGPGYRRILVPVEDDHEVVAVANLYAARGA